MLCLADTILILEERDKMNRNFSKQEQQKIFEGLARMEEDRRQTFENTISHLRLPLYH